MGGRAGQVVVYDLKQGRTQTVQSHKHPVTTLVFSDDGKLLLRRLIALWYVCVWACVCVCVGVVSAGKKPASIVVSLKGHKL